MTAIASSLLCTLQGALVFCLLYQYFMALASIRPSQPAPATAGARTRFAILIPAHNEAPVLRATLARMQGLAYPRALFDVHVVADHCSDETATVAREGGAVAHERDSLPRGRKAYALQWLLARILRGPTDYDAVAIFDADSLISPDFLAAMDGHLQAGARALQGQAPACGRSDLDAVSQRDRLHQGADLVVAVRSLAEDLQTEVDLRPCSEDQPPPAILSHRGSRARRASSRRR